MPEPSHLLEGDIEAQSSELSYQTCPSRAGDGPVVRSLNMYRIAAGPLVGLSARGQHPDWAQPIPGPQTGLSLSPAPRQGSAYPQLRVHMSTERTEHLPHPFGGFAFNIFTVPHDPLALPRPVWLGLSLV